MQGIIEIKFRNFFKIFLYMTDIQRIKKVINWLVFQEVAENDRALSELLGYTKSSFSQIINGRVPISDKFVKKLCSLDENINEVWVLNGEGNMFKNSPNGLQTVEISQEAWRIIKLQSESLAARDRQIDELVGLLREQVSENKKIVAQTKDNASAAVAG